MGERTAYICKEQLLKAARVYLRQYAALPENQGKTLYKIDPALMAEKVLGLKLAHHKLSNDMSILGFSTNAEDVGIQVYDFEGETIFMIINPQTIVVDGGLRDINAGRYHFTVMHEIAHHIINRYFYNDRKSEPHYYRNSRSSGSSEEWQADVLASYLLMPRECVERGMCLFHLDKRALIGFALPEVKKRFAMLAEFLGASKEALKIRMMELGFLHSVIVEPPKPERI